MIAKRDSNEHYTNSDLHHTDMGRQGDMGDVRDNIRMHEDIL